MLKLKDLYQLSGRIGRAPYALWGSILFLIKYNLDRLISLSYGHSWFITDYFIQADRLGILSLPEEDKPYYLTLLLASVPFIWVGTILSVRRLRDAGIHTALVGLFFIPFLNAILFLILSLIPSTSAISEGNTKLSDFFNRFLPKSKVGSAAVAIGVLTLFGLPLMIFSVNIMGEYGWGLFVGIPFFLGMGSVLIYCHHEYRYIKECLSVSAISVLLFGGALLFLALEGVLCLLMAAPLGLVIGMLGGLVGFSIQERGTKTAGTLFSFTWLMIPLLIFGEHTDGRQSEVVPVTTEVIIDAAPQAIWNELVAFSTIPEPKDWFFQTGIAYPTHAEIEGHGEEAVRYCNFTTGTFVEPIDIWDEPRLLRFSVLDQPPPLVESSPYEHLHLPHLENYFVSEQGQFLLEELPNGQTLLSGTTWYRHEIWPAAYWHIWSNYILHKIHLRVLNHIKQEAESKEGSQLPRDVNESSHDSQ
ncbi:MAG: DUF805 domain-containing protein [Bacteroidota bacterium]